MAKPILGQAANAVLEKSQPDVLLQLHRMNAPAAKAVAAPQPRQRERDSQRTAMQTPLGSPRYQVLYLKNGREHHSAWLYCKARAQQGLAMMRAKYGERNAMIYVG